MSKKKKLAILTFSALTGCLLAVALHKMVKTKSVGRHAVTFEYYDNRIIVPVYLNGNGPFHMIFDTGGSNVLTAEAAARLKLDWQDAGMAGGAGDAKIPMQSAKMQSVAVAGVVLSDQQFLKMDLSPIKRAFGFERFDGIIGYEFLSKYVVSIDYQDQVLRFTEFSDFAPHGTIIPFEIKGRKPIVPIKIGDLETNALIDTGDRSAFTLLRKFAAKHKLSGYFSGSTVGY